MGSCSFNVQVLRVYDNISIHIFFLIILFLLINFVFLWVFFFSFIKISLKIYEKNIIFLATSCQIILAILMSFIPLYIITFLQGNNKELNQIQNLDYKHLLNNIIQINVFMYISMIVIIFIVLNNFYLITNKSILNIFIMLSFVTPLDLYLDILASILIFFILNLLNLINIFVKKMERVGFEPTIVS